MNLSKSAANCSIVSANGYSLNLLSNPGIQAATDMALRDWLSTLTQTTTRPAQTPTLSNRSLQDPYYRFQSAAELAQAAKLGVRIDANQCSVDDWLRLPGLSIHQARSLVELSESGVPFHCLEDVAAALGMPVQRLQPWAAVLQFCYYDPESTHTIQPVNVNTAQVAALLQIPGIDLYLARAIVENRSLGRYRNLTHLQRRLSLSSRQIADLMHYVRF
jgi:DNA uptake protein ComE-like DNA-binding protein